MIKITQQLQVCTVALLGLLILASSGCMTFTNYAIPADRLPDSLRGELKGERVPINHALLGQEQTA